MAVSISVPCLSFLPADLNGKVAGFLVFGGFFWQAEMRSQGGSCTVIQAQNQASEPNLEPTIETQEAMNRIH